MNEGAAIAELRSVTPQGVSNNVEERGIYAASLWEQYKATKTAHSLFEVQRRSGINAALLHVV